jgi:hypothetical protein
MPRGRGRSAGGLFVFIARGLALMLGAAIGLGILAMIVAH